nr:tRNA dihydrouridine synthase DusB [Salsipaludibacter albus]
MEVDPPVVLAPMAGVTNVAYRALCRRYGGGLFVSEMVGARGLVEGSDKAELKAAFGPDESPRSIQLYGVEPGEIRDAVALLVDRGTDGGRVDHVDLNFGCPAPKVTRHGGGAALPWHLGRYAAIVSAAVSAAGDVPVTVKTRMGIDADHLTHVDAARIAQELGVAAIALHGRTAAQRYGGRADWSAIAELVEAVDIPVLGNGDIWEARDAVAMVDQTGCAGVVVGRGCLGRPWLFRDLEAVFRGRPVPPPPDLGEIVDMLVDHLHGLVDLVGEEVAVREIRKHTGWYLQGFPVGGELRRRLNQVGSRDEFDTLLATVDRSLPFPDEVRRAKRGHTTTARKVHLPHGWLEDRDELAGAVPAAAAALVVSGG